jgi:phage gp46-like protein
MDVLFFQTPDGGEIIAQNGQVILAEGLETAAYLSCFGGNANDSGLTADDAKQFWANFDEPDADKRYRSETQFLLRTLPLIPANLTRLEDAASKDLAWMLESISDSLAVRATMPGINKVQLDIALVINGKTTPFSIKPPGTVK